MYVMFTQTSPVSSAVIGTSKVSPGATACTVCHPVTAYSLVTSSVALSFMPRTRNFAVSPGWYVALSATSSTERSS